MNLDVSLLFRTLVIPMVDMSYANHVEHSSKPSMGAWLYDLDSRSIPGKHQISSERYDERAPRWTFVDIEHVK